jgi:hypothetical protein
MPPMIESNTVVVGRHLAGPGICMELDPYSNSTEQMNMDGDEMQMPEEMPPEVAPEKPGMKWPASPLDEAWWLYEGQALKLNDDAIRFLARLHDLGGCRPRSHSKRRFRSG